MFKPVSSKLSFPQMEEEILRFWEADGTFKKSWTNNPAWIFHDLITNPRYGLRAHSPLVTINVDDVYRAGLYCNESVVTASGETIRSFVRLIWIRSITSARLA